MARPLTTFTTSTTAAKSRLWVVMVVVVVGDDLVAPVGGVVQAAVAVEVRVDVLRQGRVAGLGRRSGCNNTEDKYVSM